MLKSELTQRLAFEAKDIPETDIEIIVKTIFETMSIALSKHARIEIRGFGSFAAKKRHSRMAHNPKTGVKVSVPEKWIPFFVHGKELRERVNHA